MANDKKVASPIKAKSAKPKKPKAPQHPKVSEMVNTAISTLKERGGSSLQAIKKYIASHYKVDVQKISPFINKYLKTSVESGTLVQTKGKGASGSFKMASQTKEKAKPKPVASNAKKADKPKPPKNASAIKSPKKSTIKAEAPKPKQFSGIMSCYRGSMFAPKRSEIMQVKAPKSIKIIGTKAPSKKSNMKPEASKSKKIGGIMKVGGKAPSVKTKK